MARHPDGQVLRGVVKVLLLALTQGLLIGLAVGCVALIFFGKLDEYLMPVCEFDQNGCQAILYSLSLPFPGPFCPNCVS